MPTDLAGTVGILFETMFDRNSSSHFTTGKACLQLYRGKSRNLFMTGHVPRCYNKWRGGSREVKTLIRPQVISGQITIV